MNCPTCDRSIPTDAKFCIYCAAQITPAAPQPTAATGPTTRLAPEHTYSMPAAASQPAAIPMPSPPLAAPSIPGGLPHYKEWIGGVFLIGLGLLFVTGHIFPGILVLIGIISFLSEAGRGRQDNALRGLIFFSGLAVLFWTGFIFPGILILFGLMALLGKRRGFCC